MNMNWKSWPYWVRGVIIGLSAIVCGTIILSFLVASSSLCGFNTRPEGNHVCTFSERANLFFSATFFILIAPFINTVSNFSEYHSWKMLTQTADLFPIFLILMGILIASAFLGYLYGKFKNRKSKAIPLS